MFKKNVQLKNIVLKLYRENYSTKEWKRGELTNYILQKVQEFGLMKNSKYPKDIINRYIRNANTPTLKQLREEVKNLQETVKSLREEVKELRSKIHT